MKKIIAILFLILCFCGFSQASEVKKGGIQIVDLSFEQAYHLMLENNNSLKAYNEAIEMSKYEKRAALGEFSPKIVMNSTYIHFSDDMTLTTPVTTPLGSFAANSMIQDKNLFTLGGGIVWNIFTGGKLLSNHAAARAKLEATNAKYREIKDNLTLDLVKRYYGLRLAKDVANVRKQNMDCVEKHLSDAKKLEKEGIISKAERLHAEVAYADAKRDYKASLRDVEIAEEGLKVLIKDDGANLKNVRIEPSSLMFLDENTIINVEQMKENARKNNPQLKQLVSKRKMINAKFHAKTADYMPTVSVFATDILAASHLSETVPRAAFGGTANWMLFDGLKRENSVIAAKHERNMVDYQIKDAEANIEMLVLKQYHDLMKQKEMYNSSVESLKNAEESLRVANLAFKEGMGTSLQVTDAQTMLQKVKIDRLNSVYNFDVILTDLLKTNGDTNEILHYISISPKQSI